MSILLLSGISTAMRPVSIPWVFLSEDLQFRLKPVFKGALIDEVFVVFVGSYGDLFLENGRHARYGRTGYFSAGGPLVRSLRSGRVIRSHGFPPL